MPRDIVVRIAAELGKVLARPDVQKKFAEAATPVTVRGPDEFAAFVAAENRRWLPVIKASGAKIE
jgi:tripartite-type tricarboxylate transporter receptor subunit TctC